MKQPKLVPSTPFLIAEWNEGSEIAPRAARGAGLNYVFELGNSLPLQRIASWVRLSRKRSRGPSNQTFTRFARDYNCPLVCSFLNLQVAVP